jgi:branched-chain amino acid transport system ATP-binding protein
MFPRLAERKRNLGNQLPGGEQQMLAGRRALILNPRIILLDEPTEGARALSLSDGTARRRLKRIIREEGLSAIVVEQNAKKILGVTDRAAIIERGTSCTGPDRRHTRDRRRDAGEISRRDTQRQAVKRPKN